MPTNAVGADAGSRLAPAYAYAGSADETRACAPALSGSARV